MPKNNYVAELDSIARFEHETALRHYNIMLPKLHDLIEVACAKLNADEVRETANLFANEAVLTAILFKFTNKFDDIVNHKIDTDKVISAFKMAATS